VAAFKNYKIIKKLDSYSLDSVYIVSLKDATKKFVLKKNVVIPSFPHRFQREVVLLRKLSEMSLAPRVILYDEKQNSMILEFIDNKEFIYYSDIANLYEQIMESLHNAHLRPSQMPIHFDESSLLNAEVRRDHILNSIKNIKIKDALLLTPEKTESAVRSIAKELYKKKYTVSAKQKVIIHGDLHKNNILNNGRKMFFIDLGGARIGDPAYDIAYFILHTTIIHFNLFPSFKFIISLSAKLAKMYSRKSDLLLQERVRGYFFLLLLCKFNELIYAPELKLFSKKRTILYIESLICQYSLFLNMKENV
jgi:thiamine kinase-like enzyme